MASCYIPKVEPSQPIYKPPVRTIVKAEEIKEEPKEVVQPVAPKIASGVATKRTLKAGVEQWRPLVSQYDWPVDRALQIMSCESGGNPNSVSRTNDRGLFQINMKTWNGHYGITPDTAFNPEINVAAAYRIYKNRNNFSAWVCNRK